MIMRILFFTLALFLTSSLAFAAGYVGGGLGYSDVTKSEFDPGLSLSSRVGIVFSENKTLGLGLVTYSESFKSGNVETKFSIIPVITEFSYHFDTPSDGIYLGGGFGPVKESTTVITSGVETSDEDDEWELGIALHAGYNFPINNRHSVGAEWKYIGVSGDTNLNGYSLNSLNINYNFWWGQSDSPAPVQ